MQPWMLHEVAKEAFRWHDTARFRWFFPVTRYCRHLKRKGFTKEQIELFLRWR
jgi:hypothetical protein